MSEATTRRSARRLALDVLYEAEIRDQLPAEAFEARRRGGWVIATPEDSQAPEASEDAGGTAGAAERPGEDTPEGGGSSLEPDPEPPVLAYARALVDGVQEHQADIDALIAASADRWTIQRMPVVDRTLLRMAIFELLWRDDVPVAVAINEAVELAKALSTEDSGRFINGVLGRVADGEGLD